MTPDEVISQMRENIHLTRILQHPSTKQADSSVMLYQILANQIVIMEALLKIQP